MGFRDRGHTKIHRGESAKMKKKVKSKTKSEKMIDKLIDEAFKAFKPPKKGKKK